MTDQTDHALQTEALNVNFGKTPVLWELNLKVPKGLLVAIVGPNGAGKSTLLKTALGLIKPISGKVELLGNAAAKSRDKIAYVPQRESVDWDFPITAFDLVLMGRYGRLGPFRRPRKADIEAAKHALDLVGMSALGHRQISQLSGGQQQRLFLARALVQNPELYLLDEPFSGVDLATEKELISILKKEKANGKSLFVVHHDLPTIREYFDWVVLLNTHLVAAGPVDEVFNREMLAKAFGKREPLFMEASHLSACKMEGEPL